jgi:hypothetical protein
MSNRIANTAIDHSDNSSGSARVLRTPIPFAYQGLLYCRVPRGVSPGVRLVSIHGAKKRKNAMEIDHELRGS